MKKQIVCLLVAAMMVVAVLPKKSEAAVGIAVGLAVFAPAKEKKNATVASAAWIVMGLGGYMISGANMLTNTFMILEGNESEMNEGLAKMFADAKLDESSIRLIGEKLTEKSSAMDITKLAQGTRVSVAFSTEEVAEIIQSGPYTASEMAEKIELLSSSRYLGAE